MRKEEVVSLNRYGEGDTIGIGVNYLTNQLFFTKNGEIGRILTLIIGGLLPISSLFKCFPTLSTDVTGVKIRFNFGETPFKFNHRNFFLNDVNNVFAKINKKSVERSQIMFIVCLYLYILGNGGTLLSLESTHKISRSELIRSIKRVKVVHSENISPLKTPTPKLKESSMEDEHSTEDKSAGKKGTFSEMKSTFKKFFMKDPKTPTKLEEKSSKSTECGDSPTQVQILPLSDETAFMERSNIRRMILAERYLEAESVLSMMFPRMYKEQLQLQALLKSLHFLKLFKQDQGKALTFAKEVFTTEIKSQRLRYIDTSNKLIFIDVKVQNYFKRRN